MNAAPEMACAFAGSQIPARSPQGLEGPFPVVRDGPAAFNGLLTLLALAIVHRFGL